MRYYKFTISNKKLKKYNKVCKKQYDLDGLRQNFYKILSKFPGLKYANFVYNSPKNIKNFEKYTII